MPRAHISLGGNLGAVARTFDAALDHLNKLPGNAVIAVSRYLGTSPVGDHAGSGFLNAATAIDTRLEPLELLDLLHRSSGLELGRTRTIRWGPRTLDLDLIFYRSEFIDMPRLVVPHPAAWYRRFVLDPLVEIASDFVHPEKQATIESLRQRLLRRPLVASFVGGAAATRSGLIRALEPEFPQAALNDCDGTTPQGASSHDEPALAFWLGPLGDQTGPSEDSFGKLPLLARIDATATSAPVDDFVRYVLHSALG